MKFVYTQHAEEKLQRSDIVNFGISKALLEKAVVSPEHFGKTKTQELSAIISLPEPYILRVVYDKIRSEYKIITFYIAKKGRYGT